MGSGCLTATEGSHCSLSMCDSCCDCTPGPWSQAAGPPRFPAPASFRPPSLGMVAAGMAPVSLEGWSTHPIPSVHHQPVNTHTHAHTHTHTHTHTPAHAHAHAHAHTHTYTHSDRSDFFCLLSFNQALRLASVTALSTRRVKDLSPWVTSLTVLLTDRPLAHLACDVAPPSASFTHVPSLCSQPLSVATAE